MLGTRPILIPLSVLLSVSHSLRISVISPFSREYLPPVGKGVSRKRAREREALLPRGRAARVNRSTPGLK